MLDDGMKLAHNMKLNPNNYYQEQYQEAENSADEFEYGMEQSQPMTLEQQKEELKRKLMQISKKDSKKKDEAR